MKKMLTFILCLSLFLGLAVVPAHAAQLKPLSLQDSLSDRFIIKANGELWYLDMRVDYNNIREDGTYGYRPPVLAMTGAAAVGTASYWAGPYDRYDTTFVLMSNGDLYQIWMEESPDPTPKFGKELIDTGVSVLHGTLYLKDGNLYSLYSEQSHLIMEDVISFTGFGNGSYPNEYIACVTSDHVLHYHYVSDSYQSSNWEDLEGFTQVYSVSSRFDDTYFAVAEDGSLYAWGLNTSGQVGNGGGDYRSNYSGIVRMNAQPGELTTLTLRDTSPVKVLDSVTGLYLNADRIYARDASGELWMWGDATEHFKAPLKRGSYGWTIDADEIIVPDLTCYYPRRSDTAQPVYSSVKGFKFAADGSMYYGTDPEPIPFNISELVSCPNGVMPVEIVEPFTDVLVTDYFAGPVRWALSSGITAGTSASTFSPGDTCTRGQIITFLWRAAGSPAPVGACPFGDVAPGNYYSDAVTWAAEQGIAAGPAFRANEPCTRLEAVEFIWKYAGSPAAAAAGFTDVTSPAVDWALSSGVTAGTSASTFSPNSTCTRGQIVSFLYRAMG